MKIEFKKYQHIERFGTDEVDGIETGECLIFPKVDGINASAWLDNGETKAGSRRKEITLEEDYNGFYRHILDNENIKKYLKKHPTHRLYGEFLVKKSLKTYRGDAWKKFYIFDITVDNNRMSKRDAETVDYIPYDTYKSLLEEFNLEYIPPLARIKKPNYESLVKLLDKNNYLIKNGKGKGEGIIIKRYNFYNKWGRQTWAKIVRNEFKEKHSKEMGVPEIKPLNIVEEKIINNFVTKSFIEKEYVKIINEKNGWKSQYIPELLCRVFHELVVEETWNIVKKYKKPKIDFKRLNNMVIHKVKEVKSEIFN